MWHKQHEEAFKLAQNETAGHFHKCPKCMKWVCDVCWNDEEGLCVEDAPRVAAEIAAARATVRKDQIWKKAEETQIFKGEIKPTQTVCPYAGKLRGQENSVQTAVPHSQCLGILSVVQRTPLEQNSVQNAETSFKL